MARRPAILLTLGVLSCAGPSSALDPAGRSAERIAALFWWMTGGAFAVWFAVSVLVVWAVWFHRGSASAAFTRRLVVIGGVVLPLLLLTVLLGFGLGMLPAELAPAPAGALQVHVSGEQWWWRVRYGLPDGGTVELANELHLPLAEPTQLTLSSPDVIHSFWVPALAGKIDMIPGRTTRLVLEPTRAGTFNGFCAEYCGASHALMRLDAVVQRRESFDAWLRAEAEPARVTEGRGADLFLSTGCGACHTVRGTRANGVVGPDLTHVGSRVTLAAGALPNQADALMRWVKHPAKVKPLATMPAFAPLGDDDLRALAQYLKELR